MFKRHRSRYAQCLADDLARKPETSRMPLEPDGLLACAEKPHHQPRCDNLRRHSAKCRAKHSETGSGHSQTDRAKTDFTCRENQEKVEDDVKHTHHHVKPARNLHVADTPEHGSSEIIHGEQRKGKYKNKKIERCLAAYGLCPSKPDGQRPRYGRSDSHNSKAEQQTGHYRLTQYPPRPIMV